MRWPHAAALVCLAMLGCQAEPPKLSAVEWSALETREVDGRRDDVLRAASAVVLDKGYFYLASDRDAGLITAEFVPPPVQDAFRRSGGMRGSVVSDTLAVWVRQSGPERSEVRLQTRVQGVHVADAKRVTEFWESVQRRMLGGNAAPTTPAAPPLGGRS